MKSSMRLFKLILFIPVILYNCSTQEVCEEDLKGEAIATFFKMEDGKPADTLISGVTVYGIRKEMNDSLLYDSVKTNRLRLPLDPNNGESVFVLNIQENKDTIGVIHSSTVYLISYTCGFSNNFEISLIYNSHQIIADIEIINQGVYAEDSETEEHFRIYF